MLRTSWSLSLPALAPSPLREEESRPVTRLHKTTNLRPRMLIFNPNPNHLQLNLNLLQLTQSLNWILLTRTFTPFASRLLPQNLRRKTLDPYSNLDDHIKAIEAGSHMELDDSIQMNDAYPDTPNTIRKVYNCPDKSNDPDSSKTYSKAVENQVKKDIEVLTSMIKNPEKPIKYNRSSQSNPSNVELSDNISGMLMRSEILKRIITSEVTLDSMDETHITHQPPI
ncbi:unnamed protein product [Ambrosiozyma monospora]|uniref:Unnamed protein product n=1 Tax=Ambrosiozyma monospora TaxID=43982 RepID=A0A9W6TAY9_AMBMO|nr:unnamed protein product [Ambrosiozyma monospora]